MIAIDEAHCIFQWGDGFRKAFGELGRLRSFVPTSVPILATSATLQPLVLNDIQSRLHFSVQDTFLVNLGNHRANITNFLCKCELPMILGLLIFSSMKHCLVNLSDERSFFLILVIWLIKVPNTSNNFSPRLVIMKSIFYMQVVTDERGAKC